MIQVVYGDGQNIICVEQWRAIGSDVTGSIIIYIGIDAFELFIFNVLYKLYCF